MREGEFSRTALAAAAMRTAHQTLDGARIFADPLAARLIEAAPEADAPERRPLRLFIALRSRIAEDAARRALSEGVRQIVVLGAGLDTFGYRLAPLDGLRVFEIDHPATQAEKRRRLAEAGIVIPPHLVYAPVDFERERLDPALAAAAFDATRGAFFLWLGVTPYLTSEASTATLEWVGGLAGGAEIVFDYVNPRADDFHARLAAHVEALGERLIGAFETDDLHARLTALGFDEIEDSGPREIRARLAPGLAAPASNNGAHILRARRRPPPPATSG